MRGGLNVRRKTAIVLFRIEIDFFRFRYEIVRSLAFALRVQYCTVLYCTVPKTVTIAVDRDRDIFGCSTVHFVRGEGEGEGV